MMRQKKSNMICITRKPSVTVCLYADSYVINTTMSWKIAKKLLMKHKLILNEHDITNICMEKINDSFALQAHK